MAAGVLATLGRLSHRPWFVQSGAPLLDPWVWQAAAIALAVLGIAWTALRLFVQRTTQGAVRANDLSRTPPSLLTSARRLADGRWSVDRVVNLALAVLLLVLALCAATPGIAWELAPAGANAAPFHPTLASIHAGGIGAWALLAALLVFAGLAQREWARDHLLQAVLVLLWAACPLLASRGGGAGASAMRWTLAAYLLAIPLVLRLTSWSLPRVPAAAVLRPVVGFFGLLPLLVLTAWPMGAAIVGLPLAGPPPESRFAALSPAVSYAGPLLMVAGLLTSAALRRRSPRQALGAIAAANVAASAAFVMSVARPGLPLDGTQWMRVIQIDVVVTSVSALFWLGAIAFAGWRKGAMRWIGAGDDRPRALKLIVIAALAVIGLTAVPGMAELFVSPAHAGELATSAGGAWGWIALLLSIAAAGWTFAPLRSRLSPAGAGGMLSVIAAMLAFAALGAAPGTWLAYHTWMASLTAAACAMLGLGWALYRRDRGTALAPPSTVVVNGTTDVRLRSTVSSDADATPHTPPVLDYQEPQPAEPPDGAEGIAHVCNGRTDVRAVTARWAGVLGAGAVLLAMRAMPGDPGAPWWSVGVVMMVSLLVTGISVWLAAPGCLYESGALVCLAASLWYLGRASSLRAGLIGLAHVNVIALTLPAIGWLVLERQIFASRRRTRRWRLPSVHRSAAGVSAVAVTLIVALQLASAIAGGTPPAPNALLAWGALLSTAALLVACLWDPQARFATAALYLLGLAVIGNVLVPLGLSPRWLAWCGAIALAAHALLTSTFWFLRDALSATAERLALPSSLSENPRRWLAPCNAVIAVVVIALAFWTDQSFLEPHARTLISLAALLQCVSIALLTRGRRGAGLRQMAVLLLPAGLVLLAWSTLSPLSEGAWLHRAVLAAAIVTTIAIGASEAARRPALLGESWHQAVRRCATLLTVVALLSLFAVLSGEAGAQITLGNVPMGGLFIALGALTFAAMGAHLLRVAVATQIPSAARGTDRYVYLAELLLAGLFVHLRLTMPLLFGGVMRHYWPLLIMAIAFAGVGAGELLRRKDHLTFARPLQNSGIFLPLLPALSFWMAGSRVDYSALMVVVALLYGSLAVLRHSFRFAILAAAAGNIALRYLLHRTEQLGFLAHPQLWVIPAGLSVLAAAEAHRRTLPDEQLRALRYTVLSAIYLSSTADIFLNGAAHAPWLPLVLMALSVAGVLAGVVMRVRSFLFLGTGFLMLSVVAMIWNAAANLHWTWLWYVAGIGLGLMILALFALFEKKREEMLGLIEGLKGWN